MTTNIKTDELIAMLACDRQGLAFQTAQRRLYGALLLGALGGLVLLLWLKGLRPDLGLAAQTPVFWLKQAFPTTLMGLAAVLLMRLGYPGTRAGLWGLATGFPLLAVWAVAGLALGHAAPEARAVLVWGSSWTQCPANIAVLALPSLLAALWALRQLAPVRPALAGAAAGLFAGSAGAAAYALYCSEMAAPFLAVWYVAGILVPTLAGGLIGRRLLRW